MTRGLLAVYLAIVALVAVWMSRHEREGTTFQEGRPMIIPILWPADVLVTVPARPTTGIWTLAHDFVPAGALIKLEAVGRWSYSIGMESGPDGDVSALLTAVQALAPKAPVGALIAKVGGSTAGIADGVLYTVGSRAVIRVKADAEGPLYLTINDHVTGLGDNTGNLSVKVSVHVDPAPTKTSGSDGGENQSSDKNDSGGQTAGSGR